MIVRLRQLAAAAAGLAVTTALVVGILTVLVRWVGWPLPTVWPTLDHLADLGRTGVTHATIIKLLAVIVWISWAQLTTALAVEAVAAIRGRSSRSLRVAPGPQPDLPQRRWRPPARGTPMEDRSRRPRRRPHQAPRRPTT